MKQVQFLTTMHSSIQGCMAEDKKHLLRVITVRQDQVDGELPRSLEDLDLAELNYNTLEFETGYFNLELISINEYKFTDEYDKLTEIVHMRKIEGQLITNLIIQH